MKQKLYIFCLGLLSLLFFTCLPPPFDEGTTLAYITAKKLNWVAHYGPLYNSDGYSIAKWDGNKDEYAQIYYVPDKYNTKTTEFNNGYIIAINKTDSLSLKYVFTNIEANGSKKTMESGSESDIDMEPLNNLKNTSVFSTTPNGSGIGILLNANTLCYKVFYTPSPSPFPAPTPMPIEFCLNPSPLSTPTTPTPTPDPLATPTPLPTSLNPPGSRIIAASIQDMSTFMRLTLLSWDEANKFSESYGDIQSGGEIMEYKIVSNGLGLPVPDDISQAYYLHNFFSGGETFSYLSYYQSGRFHALRWSKTTTGALTITPLPAIMHQINAILSTGKILAIVNKIAYIYNADGKFEFDFPLGDLHYAGEVLDVNTEAIMVFTLANTLHGEYDGDWGTALFFDVYTIQTKDLDKLK